MYMEKLLCNQAFHTIIVNPTTKVTKKLKIYRCTSLYTTNKSWSATISTSNGTSCFFIDFSGPIAGFSKPTAKMIMMQV
jgi:hypothetical protein